MTGRCCVRGCRDPLASDSDLYCERHLDGLPSILRVGHLMESEEGSE
jgi:hypothetical protein